MANCLITYNILCQSDRKQKLIDSIRQEPGWARINPNTYIVDSSKSAAQLRDALKSNLTDGDSLFVAELSDTAAWSGLSSEVSDWIKKTL